MGTKVASLFGVLSLDDKDFVRGLGIAKSGILDLQSDMQTTGDGFAASMGRAGEKLTAFGGQLTVLGSAVTTLTGPLVGFGQTALSASTDFDEAMKNVQAAAGYTSDDMAEITKQVLEIGAASRYGPQQAADAFYEIAGGVTDASSRMAIFEASIHAAQAGNADLGATTSAMIGIMNSYSFGAEKAGFASDVLTRAVGTGKGSMEEFGPALAKVSQMASGLGIDFSDVGSAVAYMTTKNIPAAESATMLQNMMTSLLNPTADLETAIHDLGFTSGRAMIEQVGLTGAYEKLSAYNGGELDGLVTNVEALRGATTLTTDEFVKFDKAFKGSPIVTWNGQTGSMAAMETFYSNIQGATAAAESVQLESAAAQFDLLNSQVSALNVEVGTALTPSLLDLTNNTLGPLVGQVTDWVKANPQLVSTLLLVVGTLAVFGVTVTVVGTILTALGTILTAGAALWTTLTGVVTFAGAMFGVTGASATGAGIAMAATQAIGSAGTAIWAILSAGLTILGGVFGITGISATGMSVGLTAAAGGASALGAGMMAAIGPILAVVAAIAGAIAAVNHFNSVVGAGKGYAVQSVVASEGLTKDELWNQAATSAVAQYGPGLTADLAARYTYGQLEGSLTSRDSGGPGMAGQPYYIGTGAQPEMFIPETNGTFVPANQQGKGGMGDTYHVNVYANDAAGGEAAGDAFGRRLKEQRASRG